MPSQAIKNSSRRACGLKSRKSGGCHDAVLSASGRRGLTTVEITVAILILSSMAVWIVQTALNSFKLTAKTEENTLGAVAAATVMDRLRDCINLDPRFFSEQSLVEMVIKPPDPSDISRFEHWGLFTDQDTSTLGLPEDMPKLCKSRLFENFDTPDTASDSARFAGLVFHLVISNEFSSDFSDEGAALLCKKALVEIYQLKDLVVGNLKPTFRLTRSFLVPNLSLRPDEVAIINAQTSIDDAEKVVEEVIEKIAPELSELDEFPEAQRFAAILMLIAVEMNRLAFECRNVTLSGVATPTIPVWNQPYWGYETQIASLEPPLIAADTAVDESFEGVIKRATLHRRAAARILEAHKRSVRYSRLLQAEFQNLRDNLRVFIVGPYLDRMQKLKEEHNRTASMTEKLAEIRYEPVYPPSMPADAAVSILRLVEESREWDKLFSHNRGDHLRLLRLACLYKNFLDETMPEVVHELESLPLRYISHLRSARDRYFELISDDCHLDKMTPQALHVFANNAVEAQFALALTGTDTAEIKVLLETLQGDHRLQEEAPTLFKYYWEDQVNIAKGLNSKSAGAGLPLDLDFRKRNVSYTRDIIPTLWGIAENPASFSRLFDGDYDPVPIIRDVLDEFRSTQFDPPDNWTLGGFISTTSILNRDSVQRLTQFDRYMRISEDTPSAVRDSVLVILRAKGAIAGITDPTIEQMLASKSTRIPCPTLHPYLNP